MNRKELQDKIARLDEKLIKLINQRGSLTEQAGSYLGARKPDMSPVGEEKIIRKVARANPGPIKAAAISAVYREIISACRGDGRPDQSGLPGGRRQLLPMGRPGSTLAPPSSSFRPRV